MRRSPVRAAARPARRAAASSVRRPARRSTAATPASSPSTTSSASSRMLKFHPLVVASRAAVADDAIALTFAMPPALAGEFRFRAGQHVALRQLVAGREERRTYSIVNPEGAAALTIGV